MTQAIHDYLKFLVWLSKFCYGRDVMVTYVVLSAKYMLLVEGGGGDFTLSIGNLQYFPLEEEKEEEEGFQWRRFPGCCCCRSIFLFQKKIYFFQLLVKHYNRSRRYLKMICVYCLTFEWLMLGLVLPTNILLLLLLSLAPVNKFYL